MEQGPAVSVAPELLAMGSSLIRTHDSGVLDWPVVFPHSLALPNNSTVSASQHVPAPAGSGKHVPALHCTSQLGLGSCTARHRMAWRSMTPHTTLVLVANTLRAHGCGLIAMPTDPSYALPCVHAQATLDTTDPSNYVWGAADAYVGAPPS